MVKFEVLISTCANTKKGNIHGVRKGSSTNAATGTTFPSSSTSLAQRGEWSMGNTMYMCFQFT